MLTRMPTATHRTHRTDICTGSEQCQPLVQVDPSGNLACAEMGVQSHHRKKLIRGEAAKRKTHEHVPKAIQACKSAMSQYCP